jgi:cytochrome c
MQQVLAIAAILFACLFPSSAFAVSEHGTEAEAVAMVKSAIRHYDKHGREKSMADFSRSPGPFVAGDLYVTVYDMKGNALAHTNPKMIGKNLIDLRDSDGKSIVRERVEAAQKQPSGWQDYKFYNPVTKRIEPKHMYWEKRDGLIFACGVYRAE